MEPLECRELLNAAPVIDGEAMFMLDPIDEDVAPAANTGTLVVDLTADGVTDTDPTDTLGIAITDLDTQYGTWQYTTNGTDWHDLSAPMAGDAFLLAGDVTTAIRFLPEQDFFGEIDPAITFYAWDGTTGTAGTTADVSAVGGETAFSSDMATASLGVLPVNDAPTFDLGAVFMLDSINEDVSQDDNTGTLIFDLVNQGVTDPDTIDFLGIAITAINTTNGTWQYTTNGTDWNELTAPAANSAFLLDGDGLTAIRFLPNANYNGDIDPAITFYAWDETTGTPGTMADVSTVGGEAAFSSTTATASLSVLSVADAPVLAAIETTALPYWEGDAATTITGTITISDVDSTNLTGATVQITGNYQSTQDVLSFTNTSTITGTWNASTGTLTLTGSDTLANYQVALRSVKYLNTSGNPITFLRTVTFRVDDGTADSNPLTRNVMVIATNDAPVLAGIESTALAYTESNAATAITSTITISDADSTNLAGARVQITGNYRSGEDVLSFTDSATITGIWNATTGTLTLTGTGTLANYQAALRAVKYQNTSEAPSTLSRTVTFKVNDESADSNSLTRNITVTATNDAPTLAGIETAALAYDEGDAATAITSTITTCDVDSTNLISATVQITGNYQSGQDVLSFTDSATITGIWNATTGTLTLTGSDTLANYQAALRAVKYQNTSDVPNTSARTVTFKVYDGTAYSNALTRSITVTADSDAPTLAGIESSALTYTENAAASAITSSITITDGDSSNLASATVQIAANYQSFQDVLCFTNTSTITGTWNALTGTLILTGSDTLANYQAALRSVKYANTSNNPSTFVRSVTFKVNDGTADSNVLTRSIVVTAVNDAPVLAGIETTALIYTENDPATPITNTITTSDADSTTLTSATVQISENFQSGEDVLSFTSTSTITGSWNVTTGTLVLTGSATLAEYQAALRAVKYSNSSNSPTILTRTITFKACDGSLFSNAVMRTVGVLSGNNAPVLDNTKDPLLAAENQDAGAPSGAVGTLVSSLVDFASPSGQVDNVCDTDAGALLGIAITAADTTSGTWFYSTDNGLNWNSLGPVASNNARLLAADADTRVYFQPNAGYTGTLTSAITFRAWDQTSGTNGALANTTNNGGTTAFSCATDTASITVAAPNAPPTLNVIPSPLLVPVNAPQQTVALKGITAGGGASQVLQLTATSSNTTLVPDANLVIEYTSPHTTGSLKFTPAADQSGKAVITVSVTDAGLDGIFGNADDATFQRTFTVIVERLTDNAFLAPDPLAPTKKALYIYGTNASDTITVQPGTRAGSVQVRINGISKGTFRPTTRIIAHGLAGDDLLRVSEGVTVPAWIYGDAGVDALSGGGGPTLLFGGTGQDILWGGSGRSILIGGAADDRLMADAGEALLIGGTTAYDANDVALLRILNEWSSAASYADRVAHLTGTPGGVNKNYFLTRTTVRDDRMGDLLQGGSALDLFFQGLNDSVRNRQSAETLIRLS